MGLSILDAYLSGAASSFFGSHPASREDRRASVRRAARPLAAPVAQALARQNARYAPSPARDAHLAALQHGAAAVVTGQQVGLFLGPLYTIYKAASAIVDARALAAETGVPVVPVFWLQTEDHDLVEIATCHVSVGQAETLTLSHSADPGQRVSIAHLFLTDEIGSLLGQLDAALRHLPAGPQHVARLARHYEPGARWVDAFAQLLADLFVVEGLVLIDPRDPDLAREAIAVHTRALEHATPIARALAERAHSLETAGFTAPVRIRPGAPLNFFHPEGASGPRYRLTPSTTGFAVSGGAGEQTCSSLLTRLHADPLCFSTSALLRPILQDSLLPTAVYVGGPGEVAYFAQLAPLYAAYELPMPLVVPRAHFRVIDDRTRRLMERLSLDASDAAADTDLLLARGVLAAPGALAADDLEQQLRASFETTLAQLSPQIEAAGPGLAAAIEKTRGKLHDAVAKLVAKYTRAQLHRDGERVDDVRRFKQLLFPNETPQERYYGLPSFAARCGERGFIECLLRATVPFDASWRDLT